MFRGKAMQATPQGNRILHVMSSQASGFGNLRTEVQVPSPQLGELLAPPQGRGWVKSLNLQLGSRLENG